MLPEDHDPGLPTPAEPGSSSDGGADTAAVPGFTYLRHYGPAWTQIAQRVAACAVHIVEGARWASVTSYARHPFTTVAATDDVALQVDQVQYDTGEGPCLAAWVGAGRITHSTSLAGDRRWPVFCGQARKLGVQAVLCCGIVTAHGSAGSLNLYADHPYAFSDTDEHQGQFLALMFTMMFD